MKSILEELYYGNISPDGTLISSDPEYRPLNQKITQAVEKWKKKLTEQDFEELEELLYLCAQSDSMQTRAAFQHGFKLGSAILIEVMTGKEKLVRHKS